MEPTFRRAGLGDVDALLALLPEYYAFDHLPFDAAAARTALQMILADESLGRMWLIELGTEPIGYVVLTLGFSLEYQGRDAFLDELYLRHAYRGRGIGRAALDVVENACRAIGVRALHLEVDRGNVRARELYRRAGFVDHRRLLMTRVIGQL
jgi:GNAT superfamily N-acetyltransferase